MTEKEMLKEAFLTWLSKFEQMDHWDEENEKTDLITRCGYSRWVHPEGFNVGTEVWSILTKAELNMLSKVAELWD